MIRRPAPLLLALLVCLWSGPALAQDAYPAQAPQPLDAPAHVSVVDGAAVLERDGRTDADLASMPLLAGDRVRTQGGRVEVLFADGSALHLDANTVVDFQSDEVVRLLEGRVRLTVAGPNRDVSYRIDSGPAWVQITEPGEYRVAILRDSEVELAVLRGSAELVNEDGRSYIRAGERTFARAGAAPSPAYVFNSAAWDAFDRWSEARRDQRLGVSAQYLPDDVRRYAPAFDSYGSWRYEQVYGYVWYPRVQVGWRPYHRGRWVSLRHYGWTWIAGDPWGWPTHHYGRWGVSAGSWFWIPGRSWAPAWVSWAYAPGYVSWCPLGWNDRPVFGFNVNVYGGRRYDPWDAWTVLPRHHFGGAYVNVSRLASFRVDQRLHNSFVIGRRGPDVHFAVGRSDVPIRSVGRRQDGFRGAPSGGGGFRATTSDRADGIGAGPGERRLPSAARAPGTAVTSQERGGFRERTEPRGAGLGTRDSGLQRSTDSRATARDRGVPRVTGSEPPATLTDGVRGSGGGVATRESRAATDDEFRVRRSESFGDRAVTPGAVGAVRAVPRVRGGADAGSAPSPSVERSDRSGSYQGPPAYAPSTAAPPPSYRSAPAEQRQPRPADEGRVYRGDSEPRGGGGGGAAVSREGYRGRTADGPPPSYRTAPERQAQPSAPPPSRAGESQRSGGNEARPSGGGGGGGGGARQPSGGSRSSGQARRR